ncbi:MAG: sugar phosphate isomerase/epimerase family protein [Eubacteriales bacterium]|jgi:sugar phosphate isomerase/epimerase
MLNIGLSTYSMQKAIDSGQMNVIEVMRFAKEIGASNIELVPFGYTLHDDKTGEFNDSLIEQILEESEDLSLPLSNYAVLGDLLKPDADDRKRETERLKRHIDVASKLGLKRMRHDVSSFRRPLETNTPLDFEREFPLMVEACRELADYASQYGITTLVENHGFFVNGADRVIRLWSAVDRSNFSLLCDIGNFICVEDDPVVAVKKVLKYVSMFHLKDFYIRRTEKLPELGGLFRCDSGNWFSSNIGRYMLRGSILGQGDLDIESIFNEINNANIDIPATVEFEGMEASEAGAEMGLKAAVYYSK